MKKIVSIIAALAVIISAASCSNGNNTPVSSASETTPVSEQEKTSETTTGSPAETSAETEAPAVTAEKSDSPKYETYAAMSSEEITVSLTLEQKASQMVMPAIYNVSVDDMRTGDYGSILSTAGCIGSEAWADTVDGFQKAAIASEAGIP
ncbi:MAG: beta-N-acetylhexosaminidase, partial [Ruminiclostridium sp.]|nr:beta-N-acetylhexosaminidase [Ruminiclostridium sp.]